MNPKKFATVLVLALVAILFLVGAVHLYGSGASTDFGRVKTDRFTDKNGQPTAIFSSRHDWPLHPSRLMEYTQYYKDGKIWIETFTIQDDGVVPGWPSLISGVHSDDSGIHDPWNRKLTDDELKKASDLLTAQRTRFGLPAPTSQN